MYPSFKECAINFAKADKKDTLKALMTSKRKIFNEADRTAANEKYNKILFAYWLTLITGKSAEIRTKKLNYLLGRIKNNDE